MYSEEFPRDAVELHRATAGATMAGIAADLGIVNSTWSAWCKASGVSVRGRPADPGSGAAPAGETPTQELAWLRGRVAELEPDQRKLSSERDILRAAAQYFAGQTRW